MVSMPDQATGERLAETETFHSVVYQSQFSSWPVACSGLRVISPANSYPTHDVSCICPSACRVSEWIDRSLQLPIPSIRWQRPHSLSPYSSLYCTFTSAADFSPASPLPSTSLDAPRRQVIRVTTLDRCAFSPRYGYIVAW
jgi:hypothetical protein